MIRKIKKLNNLNNIEEIIPENDAFWILHTDVSVSKKPSSGGFFYRLTEEKRK